MSDGERKIHIGLIAASSVVPRVELAKGMQRLADAGFVVSLPRQVSQHHFTFAGTDVQRCQQLWEYATHDRLPVIWAARGGYGAARLLPMLDELSCRHGPPPLKKLLVGFSDVTVLHEFVRTRWGWSTLHAHMPAAANFSTFEQAEFDAIVAYVRKQPADAPWAHKPLTWLTDPPAAPIRAELVGGNLSLWQTLIGTKWQPSTAGRILFLEDLGEAYYRIDRMVTHLAQAGMLDGAAAIVLGDFCECKDEDNQCWADDEQTQKKSLRRTYDEREAFDEIFGVLGRRLGIPVAYGLPVGHGPHFAPLPLGARYELGPEGRLKLLEWDWLA